MVTGQGQSGNKLPHYKARWSYWRWFPIGMRSSNSAMPEEELGELRRHVRTGRPLGDETFAGRLEEMLGRALKPQKRGPKSKDRAN